MADVYKPGETTDPTIWQWLFVPYDDFDHIKSNSHVFYRWHYSIYVAAVYLAVVYWAHLSEIVKVSAVLYRYLCTASYWTQKLNQHIVNF